MQRARPHPFRESRQGEMRNHLAKELKGVEFLCNHIQLPREP